MIKIHWRILSSLKVISRSSYQNVLKFKKKICVALHNIFLHRCCPPHPKYLFWTYTTVWITKIGPTKGPMLHLRISEEERIFLNTLNQLHSLELKVRPEKPGDSHMVTRLLGSRAGDRDQNPNPDQLSTNSLLFPIIQMPFLDKKQIKKDTIRGKFLSEHLNVFFWCTTSSIYISL